MKKQYKIFIVLALLAFSLSLLKDNVYADEVPFANIGYGYQRLKIDAEKEYDFSRGGYRINVKKGKMKIYDKEGRVKKLKFSKTSIGDEKSLNIVADIFVSKKDLIFLAWDPNTTWGQSDNLLAYFYFNDLKVHYVGGGFTFGNDVPEINKKDILYKGMILYSYEYSMNDGWTDEIGYLDLKTKKTGGYDRLRDTLIKNKEVYYLKEDKNRKKFFLYKEKFGGKNKKLIGEVKGIKALNDKKFLGEKAYNMGINRSLTKVTKNEVEVVYWEGSNEEWSKILKGKIIKQKK